MYRYGGESNVPGAPGNLMAGNPFGASFVIDQNSPRRTPGRGPQMPSNINIPIRPFKPGEPGREGAIDVQSWQAMLQGMPPMGNAGFYMGPQYGQQMPPGFHGKTVS